MPEADAALLVGIDLENVNIYGPGTLDGTSNNGITLQHCKNVKIRNLNVHNGGNSAVFVMECEGVLVDNIDIRTDQDGLNLSECWNVTVSDCRIDAVHREYGRPVDGGAAIKLGGKVIAFKNITIQNCSLISGEDALGSDTGTKESSRNIRFENVRTLCVLPVSGSAADKKRNLVNQ